jgi:hypothetical protein
MDLTTFIGPLPASDTARLRRARLHQGWWRACVLNLASGAHPQRQGETLCSTLPVVEGARGRNFLGPAALELVEHTLAARRAQTSGGLVDEHRLRTNLLSSQPLCFNFFSLLVDPQLGLAVSRHLFPDITGFHGLRFEYAPTPRSDFTDDNSAFDVAFEVSIGERRGLIGVECKYTEPFSPTEYTSARYEDIYRRSGRFIAPYDELRSRRFNQLFRNQLLAESMVLAGRHDFVKTALFCADDDAETLATGREFRQRIHGDFAVFTFLDYLATLQKLDLTAAQRQDTMRLWARYMAFELSDGAQAQSRRP